MSKSGHLQSQLSGIGSSNRKSNSPLNKIIKSSQEISKVELEQAIGLFFDEMEKNKFTKT